MKRRRALAILASMASTTFAGCFQFARGTGTLELAAQPVHVSDDILDTTGYTLHRAREITLDREFDVQGSTREAVVTNMQAEYTKGIDIEGHGTVAGAVFSVTATPSVSVLGQEFNPLGDLSTVELVERLQRQYATIEDIEHQHNEMVVALGDTTLRQSYTGKAHLGSESIEVAIHVTRPIATSDDLIVTVGIHPRLLTYEDDNVSTLISGLELA